MTDKEIDFYLNISKQVRVSHYSWLFMFFALATNAYFGYIELIDFPISAIGALFCLWLAGQSYFRDTTTAKCQKIMEKLINSDPELIKRVQARRSTA